jgi:hypothetical protein
VFWLARRFGKPSRGPISILYTCLAVFELSISAWLFAIHDLILGLILLGFGILFGTFAGILRAVSYED